MSFLGIIGGRRYGHIDDASLSSSKLLNIIIVSLSIADQMYVLVSRVITSYSCLMCIWCFIL